MSKTHPPYKANKTEYTESNRKLINRLHHFYFKVMTTQWTRHAVKEPARTDLTLCGENSISPSIVIRHWCVLVIRHFVGLISPVTCPLFHFKKMFLSEIFKRKIIEFLNSFKFTEKLSIKYTDASYALSPTCLIINIFFLPECSTFVTIEEPALTHYC